MCGTPPIVVDRLVERLGLSPCPGILKGNVVHIFGELFDGIDVSIFSRAIVVRDLVF
jgi:hypothetical protein